MKHSVAFYALVRRKVLRGLMAEGQDRRTARKLAYGLTTEEIDKQANKQKLKVHNSKVGGPFVDWITENWDIVAAVILALVQILMLFAANKEKGNAKATGARVVADSGDGG